MTRPEILTGYVPTTVPSPAEVPTAVPGPARPVVVPTVVPLPAVVETELPTATMVPTRVPGPVIVPTRVPFWIRQTLALLRAEGQITVEVVEIQLGADEVLRGQGGIPVSISGMDLPASATIAGRGRITAAAALVFSAAATLAGRGAVRALEAVMVLPGGSRLLEGRGQVSAAVQSILLGAGSRVLAGRGQITVSGVSQYLPPPNFVRQRMVKSGTWSVTNNSTVQVTGWASDGTYPANVVSNGLVVTGAGQATISWNLTVNSGNASNWKIRLNGSEVGSNTSGSTTCTLAEGDRIEVWRSSVGFLTHSVTGGYVEVIPT